MSAAITLGIDPGTARLGYGVVKGESESPGFGVIETGPEMPMPNRLNVLYEGVTMLIAQYRPTTLAIEQLIFAQNKTTAIAVGQARGVVLLAAARADVPVAEYSPSQVKTALVGYGKAQKSQIQEMVRLILNLPDIPRPDDAADALAIALCHVQTAPYLARIEQQLHAGAGE